MPESNQTSLSLLSQLRKSPDDTLAWNQFVLLYGPKIRTWCRGWGLQATDADDVTQNVLLAMARQMKDFQYDPDGRFRGWLKTISHRAWVDFLKLRSRQASGTGSDEVQVLLNSVQTREDFLERMDQECERSILEEAMLQVRKRVTDQNWRAFQRTALDGESGQTVAVEIGMAVTAVYKAKSRIQQMLKEKLSYLEQG